MNIFQVFPSNYLRAGDLNGRPYTLTIARFVVEQMGRDEEEKPVVYFDSADKGLVLNRTNAFTIADLYGPETDDWVGKRITIYPTRVRAFGKEQDAIRVKAAIPSAPALKQPEPEPEPEPAPTPEVDNGPIFASETRKRVDTFGKIPGAREQRSQQRKKDMPEWGSPPEAQRWAVESGACKNEFEARNSWKKIVAALGGFTAENKHEVYAKFYQRQLEKMQPVAA